MNKPASELIALADELREFTALRFSGDCKCGKCQLVPRETIIKTMNTLRAAANQSGSERAGVDACPHPIDMRFGSGGVSSDGSGYSEWRCVKCGHHERIDFPPHATPPAQPAPAATHGKPDGAVREALRNMCDANRGYSLKPSAKNARRLEQCMREAESALHSTSAAGETDGPYCQPTDCGKHEPRKFMIYFDDPDHGIMVFDNEAEARAAFERKNTAWSCYLFGTLPLRAAAETSPGDVTDEPTYYTEGRDAVWFEGLTDAEFAWRIERAAQDLADSDIGSVEQWMPIVGIVANAGERIKRLAAIDRIDVKAEAKSQEPDADAIRDIAAERQRQISVEGWSPAHDDTHKHGELAKAAACYAVGYIIHGHTVSLTRTNSWSIWPWDLDWWKPKDRRRNLVRSGALIVAEIERLDRAALIAGER